MNHSKQNYIYTGKIYHKRFSPFIHTFNYSIFMMYFDIKKIENIFKKSIFWNINKPSLVSFYRKDYHGNIEDSLDESVRKTVYTKTGKKLIGPIRILTHLRYFGYCFNPVSFYYCFDENDHRLELIMAEVTNTPWQQRHSYIILNKKNNKYMAAKMSKQFHVSPFWGMDHQYDWLFSNPDKKLSVYMKNKLDNKKVFEANLLLKRTKLNSRNLAKQILKFPLLTIIIVFRIHWQAVKLWFKGATFFTHPDKIKGK